MQKGRANALQHHGTHGLIRNIIREGSELRTLESSAGGPSIASNRFSFCGAVRQLSAVGEAQSAPTCSSALPDAQWLGRGRPCAQQSTGGRTP